MVSFGFSFKMLFRFSLEFHLPVVPHKAVAEVSE